MKTHLPISAWLAVLFFTFTAPFALAQSRWSATPADGEWSNPANWVDGVVPNGNTVSVEFGESTITQIHLSEPVTVNALTVNLATASYGFSGGKLILDVNAAQVQDAVIIRQGSKVDFQNQFVLTSSLSSNQGTRFDIGSGAVLSLLYLEVEESVLYAAFGGSGVAQLTGSVKSPGRQIQQHGDAELILSASSAQSSAIRSMNGRGRVSIAADVENSLGLGTAITNSGIHIGQIFFSVDGVSSFGVLRFMGGSSTVPSANNAADMLFGADIPGQGSVEHNGAIIFDPLFIGNSGSSAFYRLHVGEGDVFAVKGIISGDAAGYSHPVFRKQGIGTAILSAANTYAVPTEIVEGTLLLTGALRASSVQVKSGAVLGGTGVIEKPLEIDNAGQLAPGIPGSAPGSLTVGETLIKGELHIMYDGGADDPVGILHATATVRLENASLKFSSAGPDLSGPEYVFVSAERLQGSFASIAGLPAGYELKLDYENSKISLVQNDSDPYLAWINGFPELIGAQRTKDADPDADGLSNFHEYAFGSHPAQAYSQHTLLRRMGSVGGQPAFGGVLPLPSELDFTVEGKSLKASKGNLWYLIEGSTDFVSWEKLMMIEVTSPDEIDTFTIDLPKLPADWSYRAFRLSAEETSGYMRCRVIESSDK